MIVAGSANMDIVVRANNTPGPGEPLLGQDYAFIRVVKGPTKRLLPAVPARELRSWAVSAVTPTATA